MWINIGFFTRNWRVLEKFTNRNDNWVHPYLQNQYFGFAIPKILLDFVVHQVNANICDDPTLNNYRNYLLSKIFTPKKMECMQMQSVPRTWIVNTIAESLEFVPEKKETANAFASIDILDYIYSVLHSPIPRNI